jgi:hypothetical protein
MIGFFGGVVVGFVVGVVVATSVFLAIGWLVEAIEE